MLAGMLSTMSGVESALIGLAVAVFFIVRQFSTRRVASPWMLVVPLVLLYFGLSSGFGQSGFGQLDSTGWAVLAVNLALSIGLGVVRGNSFRLWLGPSGEALMRASYLTLLLWLATIAVKLVLVVVENRTGLAATSTSAELMLPIAATLAAQNLMVYLRSQNVRTATA
jgi:hypothetical protein